MSTDEATALTDVDVASSDSCPPDLPPPPTSASFLAETANATQAEDAAPAPDSVRTEQQPPSEETPAQFPAQASAEVPAEVPAQTAAGTDEDSTAASQPAPSSEMDISAAAPTADEAAHGATQCAEGSVSAASSEKQPSGRTDDAVDDLTARIGRTTRTKSDITSGLDITPSYERYPHFSNEELEKHFAMFKEYDLDDSGYISPENLLAVVKAMDIDLTAEQVHSMIEEVAVLSGHENDGKLSFRDYMGCIQYEKNVDANNSKVDADNEYSSLREEGGEDDVESLAPLKSEQETEEKPPTLRMRHSSFHILTSIATSRISTFEQTVELAQKNAKLQQTLPSKFQMKLQKFKRIEAGKPASPAVNNESLQTAALKTKLAAFEQASKMQDTITFRRTWKNVTHGSWKQKKEIAGGVAPKVSLEERLKADGISK